MRLIDADKLKDAIKEEQAEGFVEIANVFDCVYDHIDNAQTVIYCSETPDGLPLMDLRPKPKGEWLEPYESHIAQECSICHRQMPAPDWFNFCPNCGADMRGGAEE